MVHIVKTKVIFTISVLFILTACSPLPVISVSPELSPTTATGIGYIAGSISKIKTKEEFSPFSLQWITIKRQGTDKEIILGFENGGLGLGNTPPDFEDVNVRGASFLEPLQPGEYEITSVRFYYNNGQWEKSFYNKEPFSIPFTLKEGRITYIGSFTSHGIYHLALGIFKSPTGGYFLLEDNSERDLAILKSKHPSLVFKNIDIELIEVPKELQSIFRSVSGQHVIKDRDLSDEFRL